MQNKVVQHIDLGLISYTDAWKYQEELFASVVAQKLYLRQNPDLEPHSSTPNYLITCVHPSVYTLGKSAKSEHLLISEDSLREQGVDVVRTNRGGDITYHGPGQLVVYPILDLENFFTDIHRYLRYLEDAVIATLKKYYIYADRFLGYTGVWIAPHTPLERKICAMGVRSSRWVVMHGLALNVQVDLEYFTKIIPCGIEGKAVTSMHKEIPEGKVDIAHVRSTLVDEIAAIFGMLLV